MKYSRKIIENTVRRWEKILEAEDNQVWRWPEDEILQAIVEDDRLPNWTKAPYVAEWLAYNVKGDVPYRKDYFRTVAGGINFILCNAAVTYVNQYRNQTSTWQSDWSKNVRDWDRSVIFSLNSFIPDNCEETKYIRENFRYLKLHLPTKTDKTQYIIFAPGELDLRLFLNHERISDQKNKMTVFAMEDMDSPVATHVKLKGENVYRKIDENGVVS